MCNQIKAMRERQQLDHLKAEYNALQDRALVALGYDVKRLDNNWITLSCGDLVAQAKVFDEPSQFGIDNGKVSKLSISEAGSHVYNYDRGLDFDDLYLVNQRGMYEHILAILSI